MSFLPYLSHIGNIQNCKRRCNNYLNSHRSNPRMSTVTPSCRGGAHPESTSGANNEHSILYQGQDMNPKLSIHKGNKRNIQKGRPTFEYLTGQTRQRSGWSTWHGMSGDLVYAICAPQWQWRVTTPSIQIIVLLLLVPTSLPMDLWGRPS
jgi:hypothetical protein